MKKICAITTIDSTMSSFVIEAVREIKKKEDVDITLVSSMSDSFYEKYKDEFHCINVAMRRGNNLKDVFKTTYTFYKLFKRERFDMVQYATPNASFYASIASYFAGISTRLYCQWGIRYVGFHGFYRYIYKIIEKITCTLSTHICSASKKNLEYAVSEGLYRKEKAQVIGDGGTIGVDPQEFDFHKRDDYRQDIFSNYPDLKEKVIFGFVGRMDQDKGVNELLESFLCASKRNKNIVLFILGGVDKTEGINKKLMNQAKLSDQIFFIGFTKEVPKYMAAMDVLIHPSYREGFSMVIQQAMFMKVAILTTDIPGPSEIVENGVSGILVPPKNVSNLSEKIKLLATNHDLRQSLANEGYKRAVKLFTRQRMLDLTVKHRMNIINS